MRRQKKERQEEEEEEKKKRRERNYEEKKIVMRVGEKRPRGKGSEILDQFSVCGAGSVLRVNLDLAIQFQFNGHWVPYPLRRGRYREIHPRCPRDFPRPERFPEDEARGKF